MSRYRLFSLIARLSLHQMSKLSSVVRKNGVIHLVHKYGLLMNFQLKSLDIIRLSHITYETVSFIV